MTKNCAVILDSFTSENMDTANLQIANVLHFKANNFPRSNPKRLKEKPLIYNMEKIPEKKSNHIYMDSLEKLSKSELLQIISKQNENVAALTKQVQQLIELNKPVPAPRTKVASKIMERPIPAPRRSVEQMVKEYEENIKPVPPPRIKIKQVNKALKRFTESYAVNIIDETDPLVQLQKTRKKLGFYLKNILETMKGLKFIETLKVEFGKTTGDVFISKEAYFNSNAQTKQPNRN